jgi:SAM-dependent methyltransferase
MPETPQSAFHVPAEAYDRFVGRYGHALAARLIQWAGVEPGDRALDVGCGPGALTGALVALLGADRVSAVEPSTAFAAACRQRYPGACVEIARAESLPFPDRSFDCALAQLVVNFMDDPDAGVREMKRVTRVGGSVAAAVWDYQGEMTLLRHFWDAAAAIDEGAALRDEARLMRLCTPGALEDLWRRAGLTQIESDGATVAARYTDFDDLWRPLESGVGPAGAFLIAQPVERRRALQHEMRRRLGVGDGAFELSARAWIITGRVP